MISSDRAPGVAERQSLEARRALLEAALAPAGGDAAEYEVAAIFGTMRARSGSHDDLAGLIAIYAGDLASLPLYALREACANFRTGRAGDGTWAPTQGEIANEARRIMRSASEEWDAINRVLSAKVETRQPAAKESVRDMVRETLAALHGARPTNERTLQIDPTEAPRFKSDAEIKDEAKAWLEREQANPRPLPKLSEAALRACGIEPASEII